VQVLSFTRAAEHLHLAQPFLRRQIKDLEAEIGVQLFDRVRKQISLIPEGESLVADSWAVWNVNNSSNCLKQYIQIVKELS
jgi:DNA-binding transcriptional LysR family regulator